MIPINYVLALSLALFFIGLFGVLVRRSAFIVMMSVELMLNAVNVALIGFARVRGRPQVAEHIGDDTRRCLRVANQDEVDAHVVIDEVLGTVRTP